MIYSTAPTSGFNRRLTAGGPNYFYGGAETALGELVRGGAMVLRMVVWHDDETGDIGEAPFLIVSLKGRVREAIGVSGYYLLNGVLLTPSLPTQARDAACARRRLDILPA
tara:strand:- start:41 stop:370 length:330 start_codon:yes stop_codon:yes gene_type:complete